MKKSQLRNIIKESIKELMSEQPTTAFDQKTSLIPTTGTRVRFGKCEGEYTGLGPGVFYGGGLPPREGACILGVNIQVGDVFKINHKIGTTQLHPTQGSYSISSTSMVHGGGPFFVLSTHGSCNWDPTKSIADNPVNDGNVFIGTGPHDEVCTKCCTALNRDFSSNMSSPAYVHWAMGPGVATAGATAYPASGACIQGCPRKLPDNPNLGFKKLPTIDRMKDLAFQGKSIHKPTIPEPHGGGGGAPNFPDKPGPFPK